MSDKASQTDVDHIDVAIARLEAKIDRLEANLDAKFNILIVLIFCITVAVWIDKI